MSIWGDAHGESRLSPLECDGSTVSRPSSDRKLCRRTERACRFGQAPPDYPGARTSDWKLPGGKLHGKSGSIIRTEHDRDLHVGLEDGRRQIIGLRLCRVRSVCGLMHRPSVRKCRLARRLLRQPFARSAIFRCSPRHMGRLQNGDAAGVQLMADLFERHPPWMSRGLFHAHVVNAGPVGQHRTCHAVSGWRWLVRQGRTQMTGDRILCLNCRCRARILPITSA